MNYTKKEEVANAEVSPTFSSPPSCSTRERRDCTRDTHTHRAFPNIKESFLFESLLSPSPSLPFILTPLPPPPLDIFPLFSLVAFSPQMNTGGEVCEAKLCVHLWHKYVTVFHICCAVSWIERGVRTYTYYVAQATFLAHLTQSERREEKSLGEKA